MNDSIKKRIEKMLNDYKKRREARQAQVFDILKKANQIEEAKIKQDILDIK